MSVELWRSRARGDSGARTVRPPSPSGLGLPTASRLTLSPPVSAHHPGPCLEPSRQGGNDGAPESLQGAHL